MRIILFISMSIFAASAFAFDDYNFSCDLGSFTVKSLPGVTKAPESPVVGLKIKVLKQDVPLYLIKASTNTGDKNLFVTDWESPSILSQDGLDLLDLLSLFFDVDTTTLESLRAGLPTDLLDTFAYLELKDKSGTITKLGFDGSNPSPCQ
jgi:hypothetical protein